MEPSPIQLTKEQQQAYQEKRIKAFLADHQETIKKHNLDFAAVLDYQPSGLAPKMIVVPVKQQKEE